ncbi:hypothetical protein KEM56_007572, partial [Ascosphaera pollenicola]
MPPNPEQVTQTCPTYPTPLLRFRGSERLAMLQEEEAPLSLHKYFCSGRDCEVETHATKKAAGVQRHLGYQERTCS